MTSAFVVAEPVASALAEGRPVVALESSLIAQGLPYPHNLETARAAEAAIRAEGAVPATIGVVSGCVKVGMDDSEIERFATGKGVAKAAERDLGHAVTAGRDAATTVASTLFAAQRAGIRVFATGGIGGVHRGVETSLDISADLLALSRRPVAVVAAGAKAILDLPRTLEQLETLGVPVVGYGTNEFPAFYAADSGLRLEAWVNTPQAAARAMSGHWDLGLESGLLFANPPPRAAALSSDEMEAWITVALDAAATAGVTGKSVTPFLLRRLAELSGGQTLAVNAALIEHNARIAGAIAAADAELHSTGAG